MPLVNDDLVSAADKRGNGDNVVLFVVFRLDPSPIDEGNCDIMLPDGAEGRFCNSVATAAPSVAPAAFILGAVLGA